MVRQRRPWTWARIRERWWAEVEQYPLLLPDLPKTVERGEAVRLYRGERTLAEILADASRQMDEQDEREAMARDPIAYIRARRPRRLIDRLLGR